MTGTSEVGLYFEGPRQYGEAEAPGARSLSFGCQRGQAFPDVSWAEPLKSLALLCISADWRLIWGEDYRSFLKSRKMFLLEPDLVNM